MILRKNTVFMRQGHARLQLWPHGSDVLAYAADIPSLCRVNGQHPGDYCPELLRHVQPQGRLSGSDRQMRPLCVPDIVWAAAVSAAERERPCLPRKGTDTQRPRVNGLGGDG